MFYYRKLYDFFDENDIVILIPVTWMFKIRFGDFNEYISESFDSRSDLEEAAFMKAFEILEEKLK